MQPQCIIIFHYHIIFPKETPKQTFHNRPPKKFSTFQHSPPLHQQNPNIHNPINKTTPRDHTQTPSLSHPASLRHISARSPIPSHSHFTSMPFSSIHIFVANVRERLAGTSMQVARERYERPPLQAMAGGLFYALEPVAWLRAHDDAGMIASKHM